MKDKLFLLKRKLKKLSMPHLVIGGFIMLIALLLIAALAGYFTHIVGHLADMMQGKKLGITFFGLIGTGLTDGIYLFLILTITLLILFLAATKKYANDIEYDENGVPISPEGTYGKDRFQTIEDLKENGFDLSVNLETVNGIILGKATERYESKIEVYDSVVSIPVREGVYTVNNYHGFICGQSGSGKTRKVIRPLMNTAIMRGESMIVTDLKGELHRDYAKLLRANGYAVYLINTSDLSRSDTWNPFAGCRYEEDKVMAITSAIVGIARRGQEGDHYVNGAEVVLNSIALYVCLSKEFSDEQVTLMKMLEILTTESFDSFDKKVSALSSGHPARISWKALTWGSEASRGNLFQEISLMLNPLINPGVRRFLAGRENPLVIEDIGKKKTALFITFSGPNKSMQFINTLFFSTVISRLQATADSSPRLRLDIPVNMILDEVCNLGQIGADDRQFAEAVSTDRSRCINYYLTVQTLPKFFDRFGDKIGRDIMSNCLTHFLLGVNDDVTARYYSEKTGTTTTMVESTRVDSLGQLSVSTGKGKKDIQSVTELSKTLNKYMIVYVASYDPIRVKPIDYEEFSCYQYIKTHQYPISDIPAADLGKYTTYARSKDEIHFEDENADARRADDLGGTTVETDWTGSRPPALPFSGKKKPKAAVPELKAASADPEDEDDDADENGSTETESDSGSKYSDIEKRLFERAKKTGADQFR